MMRKKKLRLIERDGMQCFYCGMQPKRIAKLTVDHVVPRSQGGTSEMGNLVLACRPCNVRKGGKTIIQWKQELEYTISSLDKVSTKFSLQVDKQASQVDTQASQVDTQATNSQSENNMPSKKQTKKTSCPAKNACRTTASEVPVKYRQQCLF